MWFHGNSGLFTKSTPKSDSSVSLLGAPCSHYRSQTLKSDEAKWPKMTKMTLTSSFLKGVPMIWTKTDEATASSASIVATAMVVEENDPKECLHMNSEWQIVTGETCKCNVVTWTAQYICGAIALGYIVTVAPNVWNRFPTKVSSKTNEKEALFVSGNL